MSTDKIDAYLAQLQLLLPPGQAWPRDAEALLTRILRGIARSLAEAESRAEKLLAECDPRTTFDLLPDWEEWAGLPDPCMAASVATLSERRRVLWQHLTRRRGLMLAMFKRLAELLGYQVEILPHGRPFICGHSRCGQLLGGGHEERLVWRVIIKGHRYRDFVCGSSRCGQKLGEIARADDIVCVLRKANPAHLELVIGYEGNS